MILARINLVVRLPPLILIPLARSTGYFEICIGETMGEREIILTWYLSNIRYNTFHPSE